jgi:probable F420-dependent oxidoreductase
VRRPFRFAVVATTATSKDEWRTTCHRVEDAGCSTLLISDHFGDQLAVVPALAAALDASSTLRVGAHVACNDFRHPVVFAKELATLDVFSNGRIDWGMGAGWLRSEYEQVGLAFDPPGVRVDRMREAIAVMKGLFADEPLTFEGAYYRVRDLDGRPKPVQRPHPPLLIGAQGKRMLSFASREADVIGVAPSLSCRQLGEIPARHSVEESVDEQLRWVRGAAGERYATIELNMVAFPVVVTDDPVGVAARVAPQMGLTPDEVLRAPHAWIGSVDRICEQLEHHRERWGVTYWAVPVRALNALAPVIARFT